MTDLTPSRRQYGIQNDACGKVVFLQPRKNGKKMNSGRESGVYESYITRLVSSKFKPINLHRAILYGSKKLFDIFNMN